MPFRHKDISTGPFAALLGQCLESEDKEDNRAKESRHISPITALTGHPSALVTWTVRPYRSFYSTVFPRIAFFLLPMHLYSYRVGISWKRPQPFTQNWKTMMCGTCSTNHERPETSSDVIAIAVSHCLLLKQKLISLRPVTVIVRDGSADAGRPCVYKWSASCMGSPCTTSSSPGQQVALSVVSHTASGW